MEVGDRIKFSFGGEEKEGVVVKIFPKKVYLFLSGGLNALRTFQNAVQFIEAELARMVCGRASEAPPRFRTSACH